MCLSHFFPNPGDGHIPRRRALDSEPCKYALKKTWCPSQWYVPILDGHLSWDSPQMSENPHPALRYSKELLHTNVLEFLHTKLLHKEVFTQRALTHRRVYTQKLLHREAFTQRVFTHGSFYTQRNLYTEAISHREAFTQRRKLLHKEVFTQRNFYTQKLLHTKAFTQRSLCTEAPLHEVTSWNWQQFFRKNHSQELSGTHLLPKKTSISNKYVPNKSKKPKEYISEAGPHSIAFKPTLRWNGGSSNPAEPTMSVSSKIIFTSKSPPSGKSQKV